MQKFKEGLGWKYRLKLIVKLELFPDEIEINGEFEVLKKVPKEEKTYSFKVEEITEGFIKEIAVHLEKALRGINKS